MRRPPLRVAEHHCPAGGDPPAASAASLLVGVKGLDPHAQVYSILLKDAACPLKLEVSHRTARGALALDRFQPHTEGVCREGGAALEAYAYHDPHRDGARVRQRKGGCPVHPSLHHGAAEVHLVEYRDVQKTHPGEMNPEE